MDLILCYYFLLEVLNSSIESTIVSRYVSSMKKKPSLQKAINRAKQHPYQKVVSNSDASTSYSAPVDTQFFSQNKTNESV